MASAAIDLAIGRIVSVLENEASSLRGVRDEIDKIKMELISMRSFLEEADKSKGVENEVQKTWVANVRKVAYQVEDVIDEFTYHMSRQQYPSIKYMRSLYQKIFCFPKNLLVRHQIATKLEKINTMIRAIPETVKRYGVDSLEGISSADYDTKWVKNHSESSLFFEDDSLVGIEKEKQKLMGWLLNGEPQRTVISVVGMGGSGKTTLVANTFNSRIVRRNFDCYAWLTVSQSYVIEDLFRAMIKEFYKEANEEIPMDLGIMSYRQLVEILVNYLQAKRYVVVLDDVWSTSFWREISVALPDGIHGSRVMLTTRKEDIASFSFGIESQIHQIQPLMENEAWSLFCKKAFSGNPDGGYSPKLVSIARDLVEKCEGLPLAIVALGSMMSSKKLESDWRKVYNSLNWELSNNPELKVVKSILLLSFNDLPYHLKHCFLYCCLFPESYRIKRKRLIKLWMAEGFLEQVRGVLPEEVADSYLMELICRSMLQVVLRNHYGRPKACKMHDLVREIALSISETEKFCAVYDGEEAVEESGARRLSIQSDMKSGKVMSNLRSLFVFTAEKNIALPSRLKLLRVLDLENAQIDKLPNELVNLFNLRYLNLTRTQVKELPKSIDKLHYLQTLNIRHTRIEQLPAGIADLQYLRYLITFCCSHGHDSNWNYVLGTRAPPKISKLKNLQVLDCMRVEGDLIKQLKSMTQLKRISLVKVREEHGNDLCITLENMKQLRFLALTASNEEELLQTDALSSAPRLEKLFLAGKLEKVPCWFNSLHSITHLGLRWSRLKEDVIPHIQALPNLAWLSLYNTYKGRRLCFLKGFHKLKILEIIKFPQLNEIVIHKGAMPGLQKLYLRACMEIRTTPDGIEDLTFLQEFHLIMVSNELVERIRGEGSVDRPKVQHIPNIKHFFRTESGSLYESLS